jgi:hypothetical protein
MAPESLSSRERILRTLRGEGTDRIPIAPPIPWNIWDDIEGRKAQGWQAEDSFQQVLALVRKHCDETARSRVLGTVGDRSQLHCPSKCTKTVSTVRSNGRTTVTRVLHTPKGDLRTVIAMDAGVSTAWVVEPLVKDLDDVEKILSVPFEWGKPDMEAFRCEVERIGDRAVMEIGISTPMVCVSHVMHFDTFLEWTVSERPTIERLIETVFERIHEKLEYVLAHGAGPLFWIGGSEQATPPMMSPKLYDDFVVRYDGRLIELIHKHGQYAHVHCHGKVSRIFDRLLDMGVDALDPVEPPPDGDIELAEAKRRSAGRMTLMGNIEFRHLEFATRHEIDAMVRRTICEGPKNHMILYPSATAISRISDRYRDNAIQYIESGLEYGAF